jgi:hypothetical protein
MVTKKKLIKDLDVNNYITTFMLINSVMRKKAVCREKVTNNFFDSSTGEILSTETDVKTHSIIVESPNHFAMMHIPMLAILDQLDKTALKVLMWCALNADYNENTVNLTKPKCVLITKQFKIGYQTIKNSITRLSKKKALIPLGSGTYRVNPKYFWKGQNTVKRKTMKYILEMECPTANN